MQSTFCTPLNQLATVLASAHAAGDGHLALSPGYGATILAELAAEGAPAVSPSAPLRVSVVQAAHASDNPILPAYRTIFLAVGLSGDTLTVSGAIEGTSDAAYSPGDAVRINLTAGAISDLNGAVNALQALQATTVFTTGSYADPAWLTSLAGSKVSGNIAGDAAGITGSVAQSQVVGLTSSLAALAPLASPALAGTPTAPTASTADSSTRIATTAYVQAQGYATETWVTSQGYLSPTGNGSQLTGITGSQISGNIGGNAASITGSITEGQVTGLAASLATLAPLNNPAFEGNPLAPTAPTADSSDSIANTQWVRQAIASASIPAANLTGTLPASVLPTSGVTPGSYTSANISIDQYGRVTSAANGSGGGTPAGSSGEIQINESGAFGASSSLVWSGSGLGVGTSSVASDYCAQLNSDSTGKWILLAGSSSASTDPTGGVAWINTYNHAGNRQFALFASEQVGNSAANGFRYIVGFSIPMITGINGTFDTGMAVSAACPFGVGFGPGNAQSDIQGQLHILNGAAGSPAAVVQAAVGQSADLLQCRNSSGTPLASGIDADGYVRVMTGSGAPSSSPADGALYVDTAGSQLYFRAGGAWVAVPKS